MSNEQESKALSEIYQEMQKGRLNDLQGLVPILQDPDCFDGIYLWKDQKNLHAVQKGRLHIHQDPHTIIKEMSIGGHSVMLILPCIGPLTRSDADLIAKALNKANGHIPVIIMGSLTGYHSDPGSMNEGQLISGASIIEAIVHFQGLLVIVNLYHMIGGICVTFSKKLNPHLIAIGIEGAKYEVVGGKIAQKIILKNELNPTLAADFDAYHDAQRALRVGSIDYVIPITSLKSKILDLLAA